MGPTTYRHRPSAEVLSDAVLGHHNQDATHITFGVATLGAILGDFKIDASLFTGREPDERRWDFDRPRFDSYGLRLAYSPNAFVSSQISGAHLHSPDVLRPEEDFARFTRSLHYSLPLGIENDFSAALVYGGNLGLGNGHDLEHSLTAEAQSTLARWTPYFRFETLQREAEELELEEGDPHDLHWVNALTLGAGYRIWSAAGLEMLFGAQGVFHATGEPLRREYGQFPVSLGAFLLLRPAKMRMHAPRHPNAHSGAHF